MNDAATLYKGANDLYYGKNDPKAALEAYRAIISQYPESNEAEYALFQIRSIVGEKNANRNAPKVRQQSDGRSVYTAEDLAIQGNQQPMKTTPELVGTTEIEDSSLYKKFLDEFEKGDFDESVWKKALTFHYGDETKAKYEYVKLMVGRHKHSSELSAGEPTEASLSDGSKPSANVGACESSAPSLAERASLENGKSATLEDSPNESEIWDGDSGWIVAVLPCVVFGLALADNRGQYRNGDEVFVYFALGGAVFAVVIGLMAWLIAIAATNKPNRNIKKLKQCMCFSGVGLTSVLIIPHLGSVLSILS